MSIVPLPRPEYPRPQFVRREWFNLNGLWAFEIDRGDSGWERGLLDRDFSGEILVPFAPESELSGIADTDFLNAVWYRRTVSIPAEWGTRHTILHFGAVDHDTTVWVNGVEMVRHRGGFTPFSTNLSSVASAGDDITIVVRARDPRDAPQARGKQATWYQNTGCNYTRTTGIWQTVWLEPVSPIHLQRPRITPNLANPSFTVVLPLSANAAGHVVRAVLSDAAGAITSVELPADLDLAPSLTLAIPADRRRTWSPTDPHLYDLTFEVLDRSGTVLDSVASYAGLRTISIDGKAIMLNGERLFQRLVLDQGYWAESLMTAPDEQALVADIELGIRAGFNGARLHQKVFEERYLYHCDRLGYLVWGEFGDWGVSGLGTVGNNQQPTAAFITQWIEAVERDYSHPAIIGWCPLNETHQNLHDRITVLDDVTRGMFLATKLADPTRPVIDASGYSHRVAETDVWDSHSYEQDPAVFEVQLNGLSEDVPFGNTGRDGSIQSVPYRGQPYFVSEFGGIWWNPTYTGDADSKRTESWGYGQRIGTEEEFYLRFEGLTEVLLSNPDMFGYCYTQLTDTFQEQNGIYDFDRQPKFDLDRVREIQQRAATFENTSE